MVICVAPAVDRLRAVRFGYVITATFIVVIVHARRRQWPGAGLRLVLGLAAIPSVAV
jgi:hypothetical protein